MTTPTCGEIHYFERRVSATPDKLYPCTEQVSDP